MQRRKAEQPREALVLIVSRKPDQSIVIGSNIRVVVVAVDGDNVKLGIEAPRDVRVKRSEFSQENRRRDPPNVASEPGR